MGEGTLALKGEKVNRSKEKGKGKEREGLLPTVGEAVLL